MKKKMKNFGEEARDNVAKAIQEAKVTASELYKIGEKQRVLLDNLYAAMITIVRNGGSDEHDHLRRLLERIQRIHEFRRMQEIGSLLLEIDRGTDIAWKRLA